MKKLIALFLIVIVSLQTPLNFARAVEAAQPERTFYQRLGDYDFLVAPAAAATLGAQQAGLYGALAGLVLGCTDEVIIRTGYADSHFLTAGMLGASATSALKAPYYLAEGVGFLSGLFVATGRLNHLVDKAGTPLSTALMGGAYGGGVGALAGGMCGVVDELLMSQNYTTRAYLSNVVFGISATSVLSPYASGAISYVPGLQSFAAPMFGALSALQINEVVGAAFGAYLSTGERKFEHKSPVKLAEDLYTLFARIIGPKDLDRLIEAQAIALVASQLILAKLGLQVSGHFQNMNAGIEGLSGANPQHAFINFNAALISLLGFAPFYFGGHIGSGLINDYFAERLTHKVNDGILQRYARSETPLKLASDTNSSVLVDKMNDHLNTAAREGGKLIASALKSGTGGTYYLSFLVNANALDMIVLLDVYNRALETITLGLSSWQESFTEPLNEKSLKVTTLSKELRQKPHLIVAGDKTAFVEKKLNQAIDDARATEAEQRVASMVFDSWRTATHVFNFITKIAIVGSKIVNGDMTFNNRFLVMNAVGEASESMSWKSQNALTIEKVSLAMRSLNTLIDKIEDDTPPFGKVLNYKTEKREKLTIELHDVTIGVDDKTLVQVPQLTLNKGIYAATGNSGCGKSSFLSKIKGIRNNKIWASGDIIYMTTDGIEPRIMLVTQEDYLTPYSTLLELILSAHESESDYVSTKSRALSFLNELGFDPNDDEVKLSQWLDEENNWATILSGGQKKKLALISAIMGKPDILILDEAFAGLDKPVIETAQRIIKRELPEALIFVVDHHAQDNNFDSFYDRELHFADQKIEVREFDKVANAHSMGSKIRK